MMLAYLKMGLQRFVISTIRFYISMYLPEQNMQWKMDETVSFFSKYTF